MGVKSSGSRRALASMLAALCVMAVVVLPTSAAAVRRSDPEIRRGGRSFDAILPASGGYRVELTTLGRRIELEVTGRLPGAARVPFAAFYRLRGQADGRGIHADLGPRGRIDVDFVPDRGDRLAAGPKAPGIESPLFPTCHGKQPISQRGRLRGTIRLQGDRKYFVVRRHSVPAELTRSFRQVCEVEVGRGRTRSRRARSHVGEGGYDALVVATGREGRRHLLFSDRALVYPDGTEDGGGSIDAGFREARDGVHLFEHVYFRARSSLRLLHYAFAKGGGVGAITLSPPSPLLGSARFERAAAGVSATVLGSLAVQLPGTPKLRLTGPGFFADLCYQGESSRCLNESL